MTRLYSRAPSFPSDGKMIVKVTTWRRQINGSVDSSMMDQCNLSQLDWLNPDIDCRLSIERKTLLFSPNILVKDCYIRALGYLMVLFDQKIRLNNP